MYDTDPDVKKVVDVAKGLEGLKRSDGIHAAAVVITKEPVTHYLPIQRKPESGQDPADAPVVTQYEMHGVEELGLLKMDFLGLRNLDVITDAQAMVRADRDPDFDIDTVSLDDQTTFDLLVAATRSACSSSSRRRCVSCSRRWRPTASTTSPRCSRSIGRVRWASTCTTTTPTARTVASRSSTSTTTPDEVLGDTYGLMIYQESRDARRPEVRRLLARRSRQPPQGDGQEGRRGDGQGARRVRGRCREPGYGPELGKQLFDIIEKFADYAFDKSHTFGYGLITYQTAYLKAHYPVEYFACLLTSVKSNLDKAAVYLTDCRSMGIKVLTPDINRSVMNFDALPGDRVPDDVSLAVGSPGAITFGLSAVRNVGEGLVEQLLAERDENGEFASFYDFAERVPEPVLNKRTVESLIKAGAFDRLGHPRRGLLASFEQILDTTIERRRERDRGVMSLFGDWGDGADGRRQRRCRELRRADPDPRHRVRQERQAEGREGDARPVRVRPSAVRCRGGAQAQGRARPDRPHRDGRRHAGQGRRCDHQPRPQVHQEGRPDGGVRARGPRSLDRGDDLPAHARRAGPQARRRHHRRRQGPARQA